ncbi:MAG: alcohol dehydrogenase catalytic domain-containing protein [Streptosporangiales bacterium]|nr:alcohol dehydrogenase catalytic domain-containing protein [Streptosporangiales bacterium]
MKACVLTDLHRLEIQDRPDPRAGAHHVVVRVEAASLCGTDVHQYEGTLPTELPRVLGHDFGGTVVEVGPDVTGVATGTRVVVKPSFPCGTCELCARGGHEHCENKKLIGLWSDGCMAEYMAVPVANLVPIPDGVTTESTANLEPFAVALNTMRRLQPEIGEWAVVLGCGPIGLAQIAMARIAGARVIAVDLRAEALDLARTFGAEQLVDASVGDVHEAVLGLTGDGADIVIEAAGTKPTVGAMVGLARKHGRLANVGIQTTMGSIDLIPYMMKCLTMHGIGGNGGKGQYETCLRLTAEGVIRPDTLITHRAPLADARELFELASEKREGVIKAVLVP